MTCWDDSALITSMKPRSLLDQDLYKFNMAQIIFNRFMNINVEYKFTCRNAENVKFFSYIRESDFELLFSYLKEIRLSSDEYDYLKKQRYFSEGFLTWLRHFKFEPEEHIFITKLEDGSWDMRIRGPWIYTIFYEIFILAFLNETFAYNYQRNYSLSSRKDIESEAYGRLNDKLAILEAYNSENWSTHLKIVEFGTRRRFSFNFQQKVIEEFMKHPSVCEKNFVGTSNVYFAKMFNIKPLGTIAHEAITAMQGIYPIQFSQIQIMRIWLHEYKGAWGTMLSDTLGDDKFFKDFSFDLAKGFDGVRHDSGDPYKFAERVIQMYKKYNIPPTSKRIMFSDGLTIQKAIDIHKKFRSDIGLSFGIGTHLTNDAGIPVPQIVIKMTKSNGQPVAKLSNDIGKASCEDQLYLDYIKHAVTNY